MSKPVHTSGDVVGEDSVEPTGAQEAQEVEEELSGADRRLHERVPVDIEVDYRRDDTFLFAYITDISAMGIFVQTNTPEPPGTRLNLAFRSHSGRMLSLLGEVIWVNPQRPHDQEGRNPGMGIRFVELGLEERDELLRMVRTFAYLDDEQDDDDHVGPEILGEVEGEPSAEAPAAARRPLS